MQKIIVLGFLLVLSACAQRPVTDYNPLRDFQGLRTYAWSEKTLNTDQEMIVKNALTDQRVHQAVDETLSSQLLQKVDETKADFLVGYHLVIKEKTNANSVGLGMGFGNPGFIFGGDVIVSQYQETELFIDMLDPHTSELIWRGSVKYPTREDLAPEQRTEEIREKVRFILSAFPPQ